MIWRIVAGLFAVFTSCAAFAAAQDDGAKKALDDLQGVWKPKSLHVGGRRVPPEKIPGITFTFKDHAVIFSGPGKSDDTDKGKVVGKSDTLKVKVDPSKKPAEITLTGESGKVQLGIYEQDGDTLKLCLAEEGDQTRPKAFVGKAPKLTMSWILTRDKKK
jgi:uncharacterized protein (TIGR03067 family)